jgi:hypothetical protein
MRKAIEFFGVALSLLSLACQTTTDPSPIPIQFQSTFGAEAVEQVTISAEFSRIRVIGAYRGGGCGAIGAFAVANGSVLRLTVGPRDVDSLCDAILVTYSYTAMLDVPAGEYTVEVFHRRTQGEAAELADRAVVTVR